jgi:hypothetical protein
VARALGRLVIMNEILSTIGTTLMILGALGVGAQVILFFRNANVMLREGVTLLQTLNSKLTDWVPGRGTRPGVTDRRRPNLRKTCAR